MGILEAAKSKIGFTIGISIHYLENYLFWLVFSYFTSPSWKEIDVEKMDLH